MLTLMLICYVVFAYAPIYSSIPSLTAFPLWGCRGPAKKLSCKYCLVIYIFHILSILCILHNQLFE